MNLRCFLKRAAVAFVLLAFGVIFVSGRVSLWDKLLAHLDNQAAVAVTCTVALFIVALVAWVIQGGRKSKCILAICAAGFLSGQRAEAWIGDPLLETASLARRGPLAASQDFTPTSPKVIQDFPLASSEQAQVNDAVQYVTQQAKSGFLVTVELAIGIAVGAIIIGTALVVLVRMLLKTLDKIGSTRSNRLEHIETGMDGVSLGGALFCAGTTTNASLVACVDQTPLAFELVAEPDRRPRVYFPGANTVNLSDWLSPFGAQDAMPADSNPTAFISRTADGIRVQPSGYTNMVNLLISRSTNAVKGFTEALSLSVPVGAIVNFSDATQPAGPSQFWKIELRGK